MILIKFLLRVGSSDNLLSELVSVICYCTTSLTNTTLPVGNQNRPKLDNFSYFEGLEGLLFDSKSKMFLEVDMEWLTLVNRE